MPLFQDMEACISGTEEKVRRGPSFEAVCFKAFNQLCGLTNQGFNQSCYLGNAWGHADLLRQQLELDMPQQQHVLHRHRLTACAVASTTYPAQAANAGLRQTCMLKCFSAE